MENSDGKKAERSSFQTHESELSSCCSYCSCPLPGFEWAGAPVYACLMCVCVCVCVVSAYPPLGHNPALAI